MSEVGRCVSVCTYTQTGHFCISFPCNFIVMIWYAILVLACILAQSQCPFIHYTWKIFIIPTVLVLKYQWFRSRYWMKHWFSFWFWSFGINMVLRTILQITNINWEFELKRYKNVRKNLGLWCFVHIIIQVYLGKRRSTIFEYFLKLKVR